MSRIETSARTYRARYVFPSNPSPIPDGTVTIGGSEVLAVGKPRRGQAVVDLGNVAILPGLVNAHTHLEFSDLSEPLGEPGLPLPRWIQQVVQHRHSVSETAADAESFRQKTLQQGIVESLRCGTTAIGEIATSHESPQLLADGPLTSVAFRELLGLAAERVAPLLDVAEEHLNQRPQGFHDDPILHLGLSPHAPYTVSAQLLERVCQIAKNRGIAVAMHLAESEEELQLLATHSGPFMELLQARDAWYPEMLPRNGNPRFYLERLSQVPRSLVIHGNYLNATDIRFMGEHRDRMSVVFCPRTHRFFRHAAYPLDQFLQAGVNVALGTDSRASNPDLSILGEMRHLYLSRSTLSPSQILKMGTENGARALGIAERTGRLEAGRQADLTIVELPAEHDRDPFRLLFDDRSRPVGTCIRGQWVAGTVNLPGDIPLSDG